jgi:DnaJ-class molecular chaperone
MSIQNTALWAIKELSEALKLPASPEVRLMMREIRGALRYELKLPDNCPTCEGIGGKTLSDGCYQDCFDCDGEGRKAQTRRNEDGKR